MAKTKGFDIEKYFSFDGEKISARTELYEYDDIFYLGVAYRRAATEAYPFCKGSRPYQAARKNRHDKPARPDKTTNEWFSRCVDCWNSLPDWINQEDKCSGKKAKERYWEEKKATGVKCSYFDVFQRKCLRYWNDYKRCPPFCCDLEPNPAYISLCCGRSGFVKLTRPDGKIDRVLVSCGGFPGEYEFVYTDPDGYKACIKYRCVGPKPGKEWEAVGIQSLFRLIEDPDGTEYYRHLQYVRTEPGVAWYMIESPPREDLCPRQYFLLGQGDCLGPVWWKWLFGVHGPRYVIYNCDGTVVDTTYYVDANLWVAPYEDEC